MQEEVAPNIPNPGQVAAGVVDALNRSTALRSQALQQLDQAHQAQQAALAIEASRVAARYGANSVQSQAIQARVAAQAARGGIITAERRRTQIPAPSALSAAFIVYGLVLDAAGNPKKGVKVEAIDPAGAPITATRADSIGVFQLSTPAVSAKQPAEKLDTPAKPANAEEARAKSGKATVVREAVLTAVTKLMLVLTDGDTGKVYRDPEVFNVAAGAVTYREIAMP
jgi:hypothetical protein